MRFNKPMRPPSAMSKRDLSHVRRVVVKIGTSTLTKTNGDVDAAWVRQFAVQVSALRKQRIEVIVVSSGAIGAGCFVLGLKKRPASLAEKQAAAAVGQARLMRVYKDAFRRVKLPVAQILLTYDDLDSKLRCKNAQNTLSALLHMDVVPIINENDTVAVEEIKFGDNDHLSALTVELIKADLLLLLTDVEGVLTTTDVGQPSRVIPLITPETWISVWRMVGGATNARGTGGMQSKMQAAHSVVALDGRAVIAGGGTPRVLERILAGEPLGTFFTP